MFAGNVDFRIERYGDSLRGWPMLPDRTSEQLPDWFLALVADRAPEGLSDWTAVMIGDSPPNLMVDLVLRGPVAGGHAS